MIAVRPNPIPRLARHRPTPILTCAGLFFALLLSLSLSGCGGKNTKPQTPPAASGTYYANGPAHANDVLFNAISLVGTPYRYGGNTPAGGFDCSGLVGYVFREAAWLALPRNSQAIAEVKAPKVERKRLLPGDLVFFGRRAVNHIGIYVGEGRFVHAPSSGGTVRMDHLDGHYWRDHYLYAKRVLR
ncbi:MAG: C40 family peptidase [Gammaproteobacteria bacterium]|nr:C40 family peptidase [Gammaproteobacteria bacterium]